MGIGNTSAASLLLARLDNVPITDCIGCGTGLNYAELQHKATVLTQVLEHHSEAKAKPMAQQLTTLQGLLSSGWLLLAGVLVIILFPNTLYQIGLGQWLLALVRALIAIDYMRRLLHRRLDGYTGDGLGATQQLSEVVIYVGLAASLPFI